MNYIAEINAFYKWLGSQSSMKAPDIALWHALMAIANDAGWPAQITPAINLLVSKSGLSSDAIKRSRNKLQQLGRISWSARGGNLSAIYSIVEFAPQAAPQAAPQTAPQTAPQAAPQTAPQTAPIYKLNQTTPNETTSPSSPPHEKILEDYRRICTGLPEVAGFSEARTAEIIARLESGYTEAEFTRLFEKAQASSFLRGENKRGWVATFDWLLAEKNMARVLSGNYDNRIGQSDAPEAREGKGASSYDHEALERMIDAGVM